MNAALSKGKETVEFIWDEQPNKVQIKYYDFAKSNESYQGRLKTTAYARNFWKGLLESGFHREPIENFGSHDNESRAK